MKLFLGLALLLCAPAFAGDVHGGGSNGVVAAFVVKAREVLARYPGPASELSALRDALDDPGTEIVAVKVLRDPVTGEPIPNQEKNPALGSPGLIQLKLDSGNPNEESFERLLRERRPVLHHVAHELFRASRLCADSDATKCPDDQYKKTVLKYHLDQAEELRYPDALPEVKVGAGEVLIANGSFQPSKTANGILGSVKFTLDDGRSVQVLQSGRDAVRELRGSLEGGGSLAVVGTQCSPEPGSRGASTICLSVRYVRPAAQERVVPQPLEDEPSVEPVSGNAR